MSNPKDPEFEFEGEEAGTGYASPVLDLVATAILITIAVAVMIASLRLPVPGGLRTAPGLLPFIVSASLLLMALGLGASAVSRYRSGVRVPLLDGRDVATDLRTLILAGGVATYIAALQFLAFQYRLDLLGLNLSFTAFEPATILTLAVIMHLSWRGPIWITTTIATCWTLVLSLVFQLVFKIPLPGTF